MLSNVSHAMESLVGMGFDSILIHFDAGYRRIVAINNSTMEEFRIAPTRQSHATHATARWSDYGWGWELYNGHGHFIAGQSSDDWQLNDVLESIDTYGVIA